MSKRYCTMPAIPWIRDWYEKEFGDLCRTHDAVTDCKICGDWVFSNAVRDRGGILIGVVTWIAVNMPWVWFKWLKENKWYK